jgi:hypothetical protein
VTSPDIHVPPLLGALFTAVSAFARRYCCRLPCGTISRLQASGLKHPTSRNHYMTLRVD